MKFYYLTIPVLIFFTAFLGGQVTSSNLDWYRTINLPSWTPPGSFIGAVWTTLFILLAISLILFLNSSPQTSQRTSTVIIFLLNLILNFLWSYLFFGQHLIKLAIFEAAFLGLSVITLIIFVWPVSRLGSILLFPYAAWVAFATFLTFKVYQLNLPNQ